MFKYTATANAVSISQENYTEITYLVKVPYLTVVSISALDPIYPGKERRKNKKLNAEVLLYMSDSPHYQ